MPFNLQCWDFMDCPDFLKKKCPAHQILSDRNGKKLHCWEITDAINFCKLHGQENCDKCPWFKYYKDNISK